MLWLNICPPSADACCRADVLEFNKPRLSVPREERQAWDKADPSSSMKGDTAHRQHCTHQQGEAGSSSHSECLTSELLVATRPANSRNRLSRALQSLCPGAEGESLLLPLSESAHLQDPYIRVHGRAGDNNQDFESTSMPTSK